MAQQVSLSPDGTRFSVLIASKGAGTVMMVGPTDGSAAPKPIASSDGGSTQLRACRWANNNILICTITATDRHSGTQLDFTRTFTITADGKKQQLLSARPGLNAQAIMQNGGDIIDWYGDPKGSSVLMTRSFVGDETIGSNIADKRFGYGVERVDPETLKRDVVEQPRPNAVSYISDGLGTVRVMGVGSTSANGYDKGIVRYLYRKPGSDTWLPLGTITYDAQTSTGFSPIAVDPKRNVVLGFDDQDGRKAIFQITLDDDAKKTLVFARPDVDVDGLILAGRKQRPVGVSYTTDHTAATYFDPDLDRLVGALGRAMPNTSGIGIVDASEDENRLVLFAASSNDPGHFMLFDRTTHHLDTLYDVRPQLAGRTLATVTPITYTAADGTKVPGYLTLPPGSIGKGLPAIVMPHGGPTARDTGDFDWLAQFFAARGFAVLQPNFRGSTGYGEQWFVKNGFQSWQTAVGDIDDAGRWLVKQGIADPAHLAIVGWSYGGYAALQSQVLDPDLFKAVIAIAPVTDLDVLRNEHRRYTDFLLVDRFVGSGPHLEQGSPARHADSFRAPVLIFHANRDENVDIAESRLMKDKLAGAGKQVELIEYKDLDHQIDDSDARADMLARADAFLRATMKLPTP